ncbi:hypothetical protein A0J61_07107 [Choanephora cucurbitarum]|uniref:Uncharacterized protein n=1 Tax=Choanephora cucurbitarum TaxID=101091 RepID=A0A1C7N706_9FUNG|nr:hypothetical protein A0J61_07107 [Choanephora cucurbitarum]
MKRIFQNDTLSHYLEIIHNFYCIGDKSLDEVDESIFCNSLIYLLNDITINMRLRHLSRGTKAVNIEGNTFYAGSNKSLKADGGITFNNKKLYMFEIKKPSVNAC